MTDGLRETAGLIGVGKMGSGMDACLLRAGRSGVLLQHLSRVPLAPLIERGASTCRSPGELVSVAPGVINTCVPDADPVESLAGEMIVALRPGQL